MKYPKLVIVSDGYDTGVLLDGVFVGQGIERMVFAAEGGESVIRLMDLDVSRASLSRGEERFTEFMENLEKKDRPCCNKGGPEITE